MTILKTLEKRVLQQKFKILKGSNEKLKTILGSLQHEIATQKENMNRTCHKVLKKSNYYVMLTSDKKCNFVIFTQIFQCKNFSMSYMALYSQNTTRNNKNNKTTLTK